MRKLDLKNYMFSMKNPQGVTELLPYNFKEVLVNVITHPNLGLNGPELLEINEVVEKIEKAGVEVILTDDDYYKIIYTLKRFRGFAKNDTQFLKRIYSCPKIPDDEFSEN